MELKIFVKIRFRGNPRGAGEAAAIVEYTDQAGKKHTRKQRIQTENDTKNALLLKISIAAVRLLLKPCEITLYMDSDYLANAYRQGWIEKWQQDGWKRANGKELANAAEWKQFYMLTNIHKIQFAPYGERYNEDLENILGGDDEIHGIKS